MEEKIRESGKKEIEEIIKEAESEAERIRGGFREEAGKRSGQILKEAEAEAGLLRRRILAESKLAAKERAEEKMNELIEGVLENSRKAIEKMSAKEKRAMLSRLAEEGKRHIEDPVVFVDRKYARLLRGAKAMKINDFGVIVRSGKGKSEISNTLSSKLRQMDENLRHEIAEALFG